ncbi:hypothetical protein I4I73_13070 [Pseudonocardia sp. KRD-184]|uniref:Zinc-binding dehydrogenase n=1 Tax=Pseudonocardia oceani TaxID=2792013 RepID=A0ABS6UFC1_9PSEU|nr:hypothetical protein [Pseudonocardia oceani]MBW0088349.1 hypothetical protein [Pseudonocardia oceani]MBW0096918.1 hypothetical protein [Pseudonocardia oceani]MBW0109634.1 hypothetical protein [Pseudonocardia oceani]MBW0120325.1 hypothetical protein [Pseudonocardia oceani]MBW0130942.1 hypothetical protein [Pseudonocardia oceani]
MTVPTVVHGTWQDQLLVDDGGAIGVDSAADVLQPAMLGIHPITADLLLRNFVDLSPGAWVAQSGGNSAVARYVIALAAAAGHRTLSARRRPEVAAELLESGADAVVVSGPDLRAQLERVLGGERISLLLDPIAGDVVTELASGATLEIVAAYARPAPLVADGSLRAPVPATDPLQQFQDALHHAAQPGGAGKVLAVIGKTRCGRVAYSRR